MVEKLVSDRITELQTGQKQYAPRSSISIMGIKSECGKSYKLYNAFKSMQDAWLEKA